MTLRLLLYKLFVILFSIETIITTICRALLYTVAKIYTKNISMSKRYSGKSFKDSNVMKKAKLSFKERRRLKREKKRKKNEF